MEAVREELAKILSAVRKAANADKLSKVAKNELVVDVERHIQSITTNLNSLSSHQAESQDRSTMTMTYAEKVNSGTRLPPRDEHLILLYPKETMDHSQTRNLLKRKLEKENISIGINSIRKVRNGGLLLDMGNDNYKVTLQTSIGGNDEVFTSKIPAKRNPMIVIHGVEDDIRMDEITNIINKQNDLNINPDSLSFKFELKNNRGGNKNLVFMTTPETYNVLINKQRLYIGMLRCYINKYTSVIRCTN